MGRRGNRSAEAVSEVGGQRHCEQVASELLATDRFWGPTDWQDSGDTKACLGEHSVRWGGGPWLVRHMLRAALATD